jgi:hypothetical protein
MNVTVIEKLEKGWIKQDWKEVIHKPTIPFNVLESIVDKIDNFKSNRSVKEIILFRYKVLPIYITVRRIEYNLLLEVLLQKFIEIERYDVCQRITEIKSKIKSLVIQ